MRRAAHSMLLTQPLEQTKHVFVLQHQPTNPGVVALCSPSLGRYGARRHCVLDNAQSPGITEIDAVLQGQHSSITKHLFGDMDKGRFMKRNCSRSICKFAEYHHYLNTWHFERREWPIQVPFPASYNSLKALRGRRISRRTKSTPDFMTILASNFWNIEFIDEALHSGFRSFQTKTCQQLRSIAVPRWGIQSVSSLQRLPWISCTRLERSTIWSRLVQTLSYFCWEKFMNWSKTWSITGPDRKG